jgi:hypothetical protein
MTMYGKVSEDRLDEIIEKVAPKLEGEFTGQSAINAVAEFSNTTEEAAAVMFIIAQGLQRP